MSKHLNAKLWIIWLCLVIGLMGYLAYTLTTGEDKQVFMPGELTGGHHQIGVSCNSCHGEAFSDRDAMQDKCESCHGDQRKKPFDSHPRTKFTDPRNADRLENINALYCVTCHVEHKEDIADNFGVTQPADFCVHCHADIGEDRASHKGMEFETCATAGCHNYHNNRSLYTEFLVKHMDKPELLEKPRVKEKEYASVLEEIMTYPHDRYPVQALDNDDADAPVSVKFSTDASIQDDWANSAHARSGANCTSCHSDPQSEAESASEWLQHPDDSSCKTCHDIETKTFMQGKHGMRLAVDLPAMKVSDAKLPMHEDMGHLKLSCNSCHQAHDYNVQTAAVESCLECHNDNHSNAYKDSEHYALWKKEIAGELPAGSGVSCATCHMPRVNMDVSDWLSRTVVQHNQNATLSPNEKMIRPACISCHGLGFSIDALADEQLIENNFNGRPSIHIESIDMAREDNQRYQQELNENSL